MKKTNQKRVLVTGAGGFIGHHLVAYLKDRGYWVRGVDIKPPEFQATTADEFELLDLRYPDACLQAMRGIEDVYALAADMVESANRGNVTIHVYDPQPVGFAASIGRDVLRRLHTETGGRGFFNTFSPAYKD